MSFIKCKMCGGDMELSADKTFGTCEYCGSTMTLPKIRDDQRLAAFNRGNHFRRIGEFDKALAAYEHIIREDDTDAEAHWCCALCRFGIEYVEDPTTYEWIPTCHRASFDSFLEDVDYKAAIEYSDGVTRRQYMKDAAKIAEVQRGILATSQNTDPFDIFICYKESDSDGNRTRDSIMAQDIYYQLTDQGHRVFFARITLEDVPGSQYEPYIFAALNSAKVMVVVGTKPEHLNAVWVKNEWSRFLALMRKDRSKVLLPCYRDMDPYDMPEQLGILQSYDMSKIGFIQDLIRGISKVLRPDKKSVVNETSAIQQMSSTNETALLKRGYMALEDCDWKSSDDFFEKVLNLDAENADAYLGKALSQMEAKNLEDLIFKRLEKSKNAVWTLKELSPKAEHIAQKQQQYQIHVFLTKDKIAHTYDYKLTYSTSVPSRKKQRMEEEKYWAEHKWLSRSMQFASGEFRRNLMNAYEGLLTKMDDRISLAEADEIKQHDLLAEKYQEHIAQTDIQVERLYYEAIQKRETRYQECLNILQSSNSIDELVGANNTLRSLGNYKDSASMADKCIKRKKILLSEKKAAEDKQRAAEKKQAEHEKAKAVILKVAGGLSAIALFIILVICLANMQQNKLETIKNDIIGTTIYDTEGDSWSPGDIAERTNITFIDQKTAKLVQGDYAISVGKENGKYNVTWNAKEIYIDDTFSYEMTISLFGRVSIKINGNQYQIETNSDGTFDLVAY